MISVGEISFNLPYAGLLLLLLLPIVFGQFALWIYRRRQQQHFAPSSILSKLLVPRSFAIWTTKAVAWALIWALACLALMEPFGNIRYSPLASNNPSSAPTGQKPHFVPHQVIFLVDTSASMGVPDGTDGDSRLDEAKEIMEDIMRQLTGQTVSLYAFTSELSALVPPTVDYLFVRLSIRELHLDEGDVGGTRFAPVLKALQQQAFSQPSDQRYTVIMLTDGGDTQLETLQGAELEKEKQAILNAISNPQQLHLRMFTIGLGSLKPQVIPHVTDENGKTVASKLESEILQQLAAHERGKYYMAQEWTSWDLAQELKRQMGEDSLVEHEGASADRQVSAVKKEDLLVDWYYQIPLGLTLLFYFINLLLPDVRR